MDAFSSVLHFTYQPKASFNFDFRAFLTSLLSDALLASSSKWANISIENGYVCQTVG
ncbi:hypothetical protein CLV81_1686 [Flagellimonas meridianipacifica]|uniref:Uncharacterized protein n=1 Tax=Flagellimonas meridianipacifica TaxID=1080225 RepID=A0A2T0MJB6_9FLAO|nr:hypothetical protein CLV81_1686 [Allomuricauda pacifica]